MLLQKGSVFGTVSFPVARTNTLCRNPPDLVKKTDITTRIGLVIVMEQILGALCE